MKPARIAAALAAALVGVLLTSPARAENDYEHAKGLIELRWYDMAERLLKKTPDKAESALGMACLAKGRADASSDLLQKRKLYKDALSQIAEFRKAAGKDHPLQGELLLLEGLVQQALAKTGTDIYRDRRNLRITDDELKEIQAEIESATKEANKNLTVAVTVAEAAYKNALKDYRDPKNVGDKWDEAKRNAFNKYGEASQNYLNALLHSAEKQESGSAEQKAVGDQIAKFVAEWIRKQKDDNREPIDEMDDRPVAEYAGMWIYMKYSLGRGSILNGKTEDGSKELEKVINEVDPLNFGEGLPRRFATHYKTKCIYYRARAWADKAEVSKAATDWQKALQSSWHEIFAGAPGTDPVLMIKSRVLKGECQGKAGPSRTALDDLNRALADIDRAQQENQADNRKGLRPEVCESLRFEAYQVLAELVNDMRRRGDPVVVAPEVLVQAATVSYRQEKFEEAIGCLRDAVSRARMADIAGDWSKRLVIGGEPTAWLLMGNSYHRMGSELEAQLAYEGALLTFWGENGQALPEKVRKDSSALIERLKAEILNPCIRNGRIAAAAERQASPSKFNTDKVRMWLKWQARLDPNAADLDFYEAKMTFENAQILAGEYRALDRAGQPVAALKKKGEALSSFNDAEQALMAVPAKSASREEAIYLAGMCGYECMSLLGGSRQTEMESKAAEGFADQSLKHFADYQAFIKENPPRVSAADEAAAAAAKRVIETLRIKRLATIDLTKPFILFDRKKYPEALEAAENLRGRSDLEPPQLEGLHQILLKCYVEVGLQQDKSEKVQELLAKAEKEAGWFKEQSDKGKGDEQERFRRTYYSMASRMGSAYDQAFKKAKGLDEKTRKALYAKQGEWYEVVLQDPGNQTIDGLGRTAKIFFDLGNYAKARELYEKLLKFDTGGNRTRVPDDKLIGFDKLKDAVKGVDFPSVEMMRLAKNKIDVIKTATLGDKVQMKGEDGQPVTVDIPKDYDKALVQIGKFLDEFKNYDVVDGKQGEARKGLEVLRDELEFRLKMLRASNEITTCYVSLGKQLIEEKQPDKAKEAKDAFREGLKNADNALKLWPRDADLIFNRAFCLLASGEAGNIEEGVKILADLRRGTKYGGDLWWRATKAYTLGLIDLGKQEEARGIIVQILLMSSDSEILKFNWPDLREVATNLAQKMFTDVTGPAALEKLLGDKAKMPDFDYRPRSDVEKAVEKQEYALQIDLKTGKLSEAEGKFRLELLKEMLQISKDNPLAIKASKEPPNNLSLLISAGKVRSLKNLGGISRGEENDKHLPELKPDQQPKAPAKATAPEKEPGKEGACRPEGVRPLAATLVMEGWA